MIVECRDLTEAGTSAGIRAALVNGVAGMRIGFPALAALTALPAGCASRPELPAPGTITVEGDVSAPRSWTVAEIEERFGDRIRTVIHGRRGEEARLRAPPLATLVEASAPRFDAARENHAPAFAIAASARDGDTVVLSHDEVIPSRGEPRVFLAVGEEAGPPAEESPPRASSSRDPKAARAGSGR